MLLFEVRAKLRVKQVAFGIVVRIFVTCKGAVQQRCWQQQPGKDGQQENGDMFFKSVHYFDISSCAAA